MSQTISIGVVGARYWSYMAGVMADCLDEIIDASGKVKPIPRNVLADARRFFDLVLGSETLRNPEATLHAYLIASNAERAVRQQVPSSSNAESERQEFQEQFRRYRDLLDTLEGGENQNKASLSEEQQKTAAFLRDFFRRIEEVGQEDSYEERVAFRPPSRNRLHTFN